MMKLTTNLEEEVLKSFIEYKGKEVEGLDLMVCITPDCFPDELGTYSCEVMETKNNGMVWECTCTKDGKVTDVYQVW